jgi:hypothetical protein
MTILLFSEPREGCFQFAFLLFLSSSRFNTICAQDRSRVTHGTHWVSLTPPGGPLACPRCFPRNSPSSRQPVVTAGNRISPLGGCAMPTGWPPRDRIVWSVSPFPRSLTDAAPAAAREPRTRSSLSKMNTRCLAEIALKSIICIPRLTYVYNLYFNGPRYVFIYMLIISRSNKRNKIESDSSD